MIGQLNVLAARYEVPLLFLLGLILVIYVPAD